MGTYSTTVEVNGRIPRIKEKRKMIPKLILLIILFINVFEMSVKGEETKRATTILQADGNILEQLKKFIETTESDIAGLKSSQSSVKTAVNYVKSKQSSLQTTVNSIQSKQSSLQSKQSQIQSEVTTLKQNQFSCEWSYINLKKKSSAFINFKRAFKSKFTFIVSPIWFRENFQVQLIWNAEGITYGKKVKIINHSADAKVMWMACGVQ